MKWVEDFGIRNGKTIKHQYGKTMQRCIYWSFRGFLQFSRLSLVNYMPFVPKCLTCLRALRAYNTYVCLRALRCSKSRFVSKGFKNSKY